MNKAPNVKEVNFEGSVLTNPAEISEVFNSCFTTISEKYPLPLLILSLIFLQQIACLLFRKLIFLHYHFLRKINVNKATRLDGIPGKLLKMAASILSPSLTQIFNKSLFKGIYPNDWKMAKVLPIFKNSKKSHLSNYRSISIVSSVAKVQLLAKSLNTPSYFTQVTCHPSFGVL